MNWGTLQTLLNPCLAVYQGQVLIVCLIHALVLSETARYTSRCLTSL